MSAITIILASLSALALAIPILTAIHGRKRQQRLGLMKLGAMSRESFVNREKCGISPWGKSRRRKSRPGACFFTKPALRAEGPRGGAFAQGHAAVGDLKVAL